MWPANSLEPEHDPHVRAWLREYLRHGEVFYDIGANVGQMSMLGLELGAEVYAFEPLPSAAVVTGHPLITLITAAVYDTAGLTKLQLPPDSQHVEVGGSPYPWDTLPGTVYVPTVTLDEVVSSLPRPHVIKSDTQGCEARWLSAATHALTSCHTMILECNAECLERHGGTVEALRDLIHARGFVIIEERDGDLLCQK